MKKAISILCTVLLIFFFLSAVPGNAKEVKKDYHETFDVQRGDQLRLQHGDGDVHITPWDKDLIDIKVVYRADVNFIGFGQRHEFSIDFRKSGDTVYVIEKEKAGWTVGFSSIDRFEYRYDIQAPPYMLLDLKGDDGDVDVQNWLANIKCDIDDGDIRFSNADAENIDIRAEDGDLEMIQLHTVLSIICDDGNIEIAESTLIDCRIDMEDGETRVTSTAGDFEIKSDDGDVIFERSQAGKLDIRTEDGFIDLDLLVSDNLDADIITDDGDVRFGLEKGFSADFYAWSDDGEIRFDLDNISDFEETDHAKSGEINGGQTRLRIHTSDGDITLYEK
jgi:hypothetical protein